MLLPEQNFLHSLHLESTSLDLILSILKKLGNLSKLAALKTVTIKDVFDRDDITQHQYWPEIDTLLSQSLGVDVEEVHVGCSWFVGPIAAEQLRPLLPALNRRGILRVSEADTSLRHFSF
jgi:hypothetical protein